MECWQKRRGSYDLLRPLRPVPSGWEKERSKVAFKKPAPEPEKRKPEFVARCKQSPESDFWVTIGAAWTAKLADGKTGYSVKLHTVPTRWDGDFLLMPPKEE